MSLLILSFRTLDYAQRTNKLSDDEIGYVPTGGFEWVNVAVDD